MKNKVNIKLRYVLLLSLILIFSLQIISGSDKVLVNIDGADHELFKVNIELNDEEIVFQDVPALLYQDRTLVPVRFLENLGASILWDAKAEIVSIKMNSDIINLKIGDPKYSFNGEIRELVDGVPPLIVSKSGSGRTLVPIRFLIDEFDIEFDYDNNKRILNIKDFEDEKTQEDETDKQNNINKINVIDSRDLTKIIIDSDSKLDFNYFLLDNPDRIVIDFFNTGFNLKETDPYVNHAMVYRYNEEMNFSDEIRASHFNKEANTTRLVIESNFENEIIKTENEMIIILGEKESIDSYLENNIDSDIKDDKEKEDKDEEDDSIIEEEIKEEIEEIKDSLGILGNYEEQVIIFVDNKNNIDSIDVEIMENPTRVVVDIKNMVLSDLQNIESVIDKENSMFKNTRVSQYESANWPGYDKNIVRIVFDIKDDVKIESARVNKVPDGIDLRIKGHGYRVVDYRNGNWKYSELEIYTSNINKDIKFNYNTEGNYIYGEIPKNGLDLSNLSINDQLIKNIEFEESRDEKFYRTKIYLKDGTSYSYKLKDESILFTFERKSVSEGDLLIIIDPGHGGRDPGAISPYSRMTEKEVVLDISKRVNKLLLDQGYNTYMIRTDDTFVSLHDRPYIANEKNADLFVSIHANAAGSRSARGVENFYFPSDNFDYDYRDNKRLAEIFQKNMVNSMNAHSRGIFPRDRFVVLRDTNMPAVLTEVGFLTNEEEEKRLRDDFYRQIIAQSIVNSINEYFEIKN